MAMEIPPDRDDVSIPKRVLEALKQSRIRKALGNACWFQSLKGF